MLQLFTEEASGFYHRRTEELFSCLQKLVIASMSIGLIGLGVAFIFLVEYIAGGSSGLGAGRRGSSTKVIALKMMME